MGLELLLIRHAESEWNAEGRWQGHGDPPLSVRGHEQARRLAERLAEERVDRLLTSDLRRAKQTAVLLATRLGRPAEPDPRYRELDIGDWAGLTRAEIEARDPERLARFENEVVDLRPPGGETRRELRTRARQAIERLLALSPQGRIAVVTHLGFFRALVPGVEPANAQVLTVDAGELLAKRAADFRGAGGSFRAY